MSMFGKLRHWLHVQFFQGKHSNHAKHIRDENECPFVYCSSGCVWENKALGYCICPYRPEGDVESTVTIRDSAQNPIAIYKHSKLQCSESCPWRSSRCEIPMYKQTLEQKRRKGDPCDLYCDKDSQKACKFRQNTEKADDKKP